MSRVNRGGRRGRSQRAKHSLHAAEFRFQGPVVFGQRQVAEQSLETFFVKPIPTVTLQSLDQGLGILLSRGFSAQV